MIYESDPGGNEPIQLYVVWRRWEGVPPSDRTDVILDAFEAVRGKDAVLRVSLALGLTTPEAEQLGLPRKGAERK